MHSQNPRRKPFSTSTLPMRARSIAGRAMPCSSRRCTEDAVLLRSVFSGNAASLLQWAMNGVACGDASRASRIEAHKQRGLAQLREDAQDAAPDAREWLGLRTSAGRLLTMRI